MGDVFEDTLNEAGDERLNYSLADPIGLLTYISYSRTMSELHLFSQKVDATEKKIMNELSKKGVIFCLGTAQGYYTSYFRPDNISFYASKPGEIYDFLSTAKRGSVKLNCYKIDYMKDTDNYKSLIDQLFALEVKKEMYTTKVQTVVDMFCDGKGFYTKPLLKSLWGVEI